MVTSYSKFDHIGSDSSGSDSESVSPKGPQTEEGLLTAFIVLHERRQKLDETVLGKIGQASCPRAELQDWPLLADSVLQYDDICARILSLDGVADESSLRCIGHRLEVSICRLGAARALQATCRSESARERSTQAVIASMLGQGERSASLAGMALSMLQRTCVDALLLRSTAHLSCGNFHLAHKDALDAHHLCSQYSGIDGFKERQAEALEMALRCEVVLHGGGPGEDGRGIPMSPEDASAFNKLDSNVSTTVTCSKPADSSSQSADSQDLQSMD